MLDSSTAIPIADEGTAEYDGSALTIGGAEGLVACDGGNARDFTVDGITARQLVHIDGGSFSVASAPPGLCARPTRVAAPISTFLDRTWRGGVDIPVEYEIRNFTCAVASLAKSCTHKSQGTWTGEITTKESDENSSTRDAIDVIVSGDYINITKNGEVLFSGTIFCDSVHDDGYEDFDILLDDSNVRVRGRMAYETRGIKFVMHDPGFCKRPQSFFTEQVDIKDMPEKVTAAELSCNMAPLDEGACPLWIEGEWDEAQVVGPNELTDLDRGNPATTTTTTISRDTATNMMQMITIETDSDGNMLSSRASTYFACEYDSQNAYGMDVYKVDVMYEDATSLHHLLVAQRERNGTIIFAKSFPEDSCTRPSKTTFPVREHLRNHTLHNLRCDTPLLSGTCPLWLVGSWTSASLSIDFVVSENLTTAFYNGTEKYIRCKYEADDYLSELKYTYPRYQIDMVDAASQWVQRGQVRWDERNGKIEMYMGDAGKCQRPTSRASLDSAWASFACASAPLRVPCPKWLNGAWESNAASANPYSTQVPGQTSITLAEKFLNAFVGYGNSATVVAQEQMRTEISGQPYVTALDFSQIDIFKQTSIDDFTQGDVHEYSTGALTCSATFAIPVSGGGQVHAYAFDYTYVDEEYIYSGQPAKTERIGMVERGIVTLSQPRLGILHFVSAPPNWCHRPSIVYSSSPPRPYKVASYDCVTKIEPEACPAWLSGVWKGRNIDKSGNLVRNETWQYIPPNYALEYGEYFWQIRIDGSTLFADSFGLPFLIYDEYGQVVLEAHSPNNTIYEADIACERVDESGIETWKVEIRFKRTIARTSFLKVRNNSISIVSGPPGKCEFPLGNETSTFPVEAPFFLMTGDRVLVPSTANVVSADPVPLGFHSYPRHNAARTLRVAFTVPNATNGGLIIFYSFEWSHDITFRKDVRRNFLVTESAARLRNACEFEHVEDPICARSSVLQLLNSSDSKGWWRHVEDANSSGIITFYLEDELVDELHMRIAAVNSAGISEYTTFRATPAASPDFPQNVRMSKVCFASSKLNNTCKEVLQFNRTQVHTHLDWDAAEHVDKWYNYKGSGMLGNLEIFRGQPNGSLEAAATTLRLDFDAPSDQGGDFVHAYEVEWAQTKGFYTSDDACGEWCNVSSDSDISTWQDLLDLSANMGESAPPGVLCTSKYSMGTSNRSHYSCCDSDSDCDSPEQVCYKEKRVCASLNCSKGDESCECTRAIDGVLYCLPANDAQRTVNSICSDVCSERHGKGCPFDEELPFSPCSADSPCMLMNDSADVPLLYDSFYVDKFQSGLSKSCSRHIRAHCSTFNAIDDGLTPGHGAVVEFFFRGKHNRQ